MCACGWKDACHGLVFYVGSYDGYQQVHTKDGRQERVRGTPKAKSRRGALASKSRGEDQRGAVQWRGVQNPYITRLGNRTEGNQCNKGGKYGKSCGEHSVGRMRMSVHVHHGGVLSFRSHAQGSWPLFTPLDTCQRRCFPVALVVHVAACRLSHWLPAARPHASPTLTSRASACRGRMAPACPASSPTHSSWQAQVRLGWRASGCVTASSATTSRRRLHAAARRSRSRLATRACCWEAPPSARLQARAAWQALLHAGNRARQAGGQRMAETPTSSHRLTARASPLGRMQHT